MPVAVLYSRALSGFDAPPVTVELHLAGGLAAFNVVGLPDTEVTESRYRVRAAVQNAQFEFPARKSPSTGRRPTCRRTPTLRSADRVGRACRDWTDPDDAAARARGVANMLVTDAQFPAQFPDISEVRGQVLAKRALEVAATGAHSLLIL